MVVYDADDNLVQRFEYADNRMPISMTMDNEKYYLHYDQVGTLKTVSDGSLNVIKEISYDTYGNILSETNPSFKVPFGFAGGLYDADTKLTRFGYRDYDVYTGKWTAKDPIDFGGGDSNLYGYVLGNPVNFVDPTGLTWMDDLIDLFEGINSDDAKKQIDETKGYGDKPDSATQDAAKKGVDIIGDRNRKQYETCIQLMSKARCKEMFPHTDKKESSCE